MTAFDVGLCSMRLLKTVVFRYLIEGFRYLRLDAGEVFKALRILTDTPSFLRPDRYLESKGKLVIHTPKPWIVTLP